jgi:hypothetical protein
MIREQPLERSCTLTKRLERALVQFFKSAARTTPPLAEVGP